MLASAGLQFATGDLESNLSYSRVWLEMFAPCKQNICFDRYGCFMHSQQSCNEACQPDEIGCVLFLAHGEEETAQNASRNLDKAY